MLPLILLLGWPVFLDVASYNGVCVVHEEEQAPVNSLVFITVSVHHVCCFPYSGSLCIAKILSNPFFSTAYTSKNVAWICSMEEVVALQAWWDDCKWERPDELLWNCYFFIFQSVGNITSYNESSLHLADSNISMQIKFWVIHNIRMFVWYA